MRERAQLTTPTWLPALLIGAAVLVLIIEEMLSDPALAAGEVEQVCGLCHVDWRRNLAAIGIITGLVSAANWLLGGPAWPGEDEDDE